MELNWLEDFLALAEHRNFSRAAEARHVTQPAFSRRIRALEDWAGTPLVPRAPQGVVLTPPARFCTSGPRCLASDLQQMRRATQRAAGRAGAALTIAATHALSFTFFPGWIRAFAASGRSARSTWSPTPWRPASRSCWRATPISALPLPPGRAQPDRFAPFRSIVVGADTLVPLSAPGADGVARWRLRGGSR